MARDLRLGRLVAIKVLTTQKPDIEDRFLAEARATARCRHENIVVIYEVGAFENRPFMVLEYIEGQTLRQWLNDQPATLASPVRVPLVRAVDLMLPVVRALAHAHEHGIIHRDLKPENVMLTRAGAIKVLDFGVATWIETHVLGRGSIGDDAHRTALAGTLPYMSPEQFALGAIDQRADVWAAGIMLFELVAGAHPVLDASNAADARSFIADERTAMPSAGERVPGLGPLGAIIDRCLIKDPAHRTPSARVLLAELEALASTSRPVAVSRDDSPFAGLAAFQEVDAGRFFGRDVDIDRLLAELHSRPLVTVVGRSGAGKSSLVRAGVLPALKRSGEGWDAHVVRPGREPLAALVAVHLHMQSSPVQGASAVPAGSSANDAVLAQLRTEPGTLAAVLRAHAMRTRRRVLLFVDQLEELYTLGAPPAERAAFLTCLAAVADDPTSPLRVLVAMRSDFLDRLAEDRELGAELTAGLVLLSPMDRASMREALLRPLEASEYRFDPPALVDRMVDAVAGTQGALPLLQFTAARLWERRDRDRRLLTEASYDQLGGVAGALAMHADAVLAGMSQEQQALARTVLERLVTPERTRALVSVTELHALHRDGALVDGIVHHLAAVRLLGVERGAEGADPIVELVHESLIDRWPTLVRWLAENQEDAAMLARVRAAARDWERSGHAAGLLWSGEIAREAGAWQRRYRGALLPVEQHYVAAVLAAADRARRRRRRWFAGILATAVLAALGLGWLAWKQTEVGRRAAVAATRARDAARMAAMRALSKDPTTQLALLREIEDLRAPPPGAVEEAKRLLHAGVASLVLTNPDVVYSAAFSPDGRRIVFSVGDGTVRVWNADGSGRPLILHGQDGPTFSVAFSPDGRRIASASHDRTVRVWNADGSDEPLVLRGHADDITSAAWSPDGQRIVSASRDGTVRIWNAGGGGAPLVLRCHGGTIYSVVWSPDGRRVACAGDDTTVQLWNADGSGEPLVLRGHEGAVYSAAFSPDGRRIASASNDKTVRVWNADGSGEPMVLRGHDALVHGVAFGPDGRSIVSVSWDGTVRVWRVDLAPDPLVLRGKGARDDQLNGITSAAFSPDGQHIVSGSYDRAVWLWSADGSGAPVILRGHHDVVSTVMFSPDGRQIVSASWDATVRVWNADGSGEPLVLRAHDAVQSAAFSPDGRRIVSTSSDATVQVWNADGSGEPLVLRGHGGVVYSAAFSPDGLRIVSASRDRTVRVWNTDGRGEPLVLRGHEDKVNSAAFSPDGLRIVSAASDQTVRVWNADGSGEPLVLRGHPKSVNSAVFSPDGSYIASASDDRTVRVWRSDGSGEPIVLLGHDAGVLSAQFSTDGQRIVSASEDVTLRVWNDLSPVAIDDPRLWTATRYCLPVDRRVELLAVSQDDARRDLERCRDRVSRPQK